MSSNVEDPIVPSCLQVGSRVMCLSSRYNAQRGRVQHLDQLVHVVFDNGVHYRGQFQEFKRID